MKHCAGCRKCIELFSTGELCMESGRDCECHFLAKKENPRKIFLDNIMNMILDNKKLTADSFKITLENRPPVGHQYNEWGCYTNCTGCIPSDKTCFYGEDHKCGKDEPC